MRDPGSGACGQGSGVATARERAAPLLLLTALVAAAVGAQERDPDGWRQADPDTTLEFPRDHASHPDYKIEWWYYTGNLTADDGRRFGYQVTFFRVGVDRAPVNPSRWAVRDLHMAHLALTDLSSGRHLVAERLNRSGVGWAGASPERLEVWNESWRVDLDGERHRIAAVDREAAFGVELEMTPVKPPALHGVGGFSQKGSTTGNASLYYSLSRLATSGRVVLDGESVTVRGDSWMDHEFGTTFLEPAQRGWDWFSIQLADDTDLMVYVLRREDGAVDPRSSGSLISAAGETRHLAARDYRLTPGLTWTSPSSGARYPVTWRVEVPGAGLDLEVKAALDAQELHTNESTGITYWEGAILVTGTRDGRPVEGHGYLEMTGYAGVPMSEVLR